MKETTFSRKLHLTRTPTKKALNTIYTEYKPEGFKDWLNVTLTHVAALKGVERGRFDGEGTYLLTVSIRRPVMLWHKVRWSVRKID